MQTQYHSLSFCNKRKSLKNIALYGSKYQILKCWIHTRHMTHIFGQNTLIQYLLLWRIHTLIDFWKLKSSHTHIPTLAKFTQNHYEFSKIRMYSVWCF